VFEAWTNVHKMYFRTKLPFLKLDYTASATDIGISHHSMDNQQKKEHLMKSGIANFL
jgi:hypothetical protein